MPSPYVRASKSQRCYLSRSAQSNTVNKFRLIDRTVEVCATFLCGAMVRKLVYVLTRYGGWSDSYITTSRALIDFITAVSSIGTNEIHHNRHYRYPYEVATVYLQYGNEAVGRNYYLTEGNTLLPYSHLRIALVLPPIKCMQTSR